MAELVRCAARTATLGNNVPFETGEVIGKVAVESHVQLRAPQCSESDQADLRLFFPACPAYREQTPHENYIFLTARRLIHNTW